MAEPRTAGAQASPVAAQTILATTRNLAGGLVEVGWLIWGQVPFEALIEHVHDGAVTWGQIIPVTTSLVVGRLPLPMPTQPGDVVRLRTRSQVQGEVQATLMVGP